MLSIGFSEILIIGSVGLIVIGPARLPETARFLGHFFSRIQRQVADVKSDIQRQMALEDVKHIHREYENKISDAQTILNQTTRDIESAGKAILKESPEQATTTVVGKSESDDSANPTTAQSAAAEKDDARLTNSEKINGEQ